MHDIFSYVSRLIAGPQIPQNRSIDAMRRNKLESCRREERPDCDRARSIEEGRGFRVSVRIGRQLNVEGMIALSSPRISPPPGQTRREPILYRVDFRLSMAQDL